MADQNSIVRIRIPGTEAPATPKRETQFVTILDLLRNGTTDRLDTAPPVSRGVQADFELPEETSPLYTGFRDLAHSALVVGNPKTHFVNLSGAEAEAQ